MKTHIRFVLIAVALLAFAPTAALAGICYDVTGLPGPAAFDFVLLGQSATGPLPVAGDAHGVCGPGTPPAAIEGAVIGEGGSDALLGFRFIARGPGCSDGEAEIVLPPPYESGTGQVRLPEGSVANVVLTRDPTGGACVVRAPDPTPNENCIPGPTTLCLQGNRFRVTADAFVPRPKAAHVLTSTSEVGFFFFVSDSKADLTVKVLNACSINNRFWVFAEGLSNIRYTLTVTDTGSSQSRSYFNALPNPAPPIQDTSAFATCP